MIPVPDLDSSYICTLWMVSEVESSDYLNSQLFFEHRLDGSITGKWGQRSLLVPLLCCIGAGLRVRAKYSYDDSALHTRNKRLVGDETVQ